MATTNIESIHSQFINFTNKPIKFLKVQKQEREPIKKLIKSLYDFTKSEEASDKKVKGNALPELIIEDFDEEQIWQQIELQNSEKWDGFVWDVANCMNEKNLVFPVEEVSEQASDDEDDDSITADESDNPENLDIEQKINPNITSKSKMSKKKSIVDDQFFKLHDMEQFLLREEKNGSNQQKVNQDSDDESIDMFEDIDDEDLDDEGNDKDMMYADFFNDEQEDQVQEKEDYDVNSGNSENDDEQQHKQSNSELKKKTKKVSFADLEPESGDDGDDDKESMDESDDEPNKLNNNVSKEQTKSEFELRQQRLKQTIDRLEGKALSDAPWQLKGEVDATKRPQNSLLQEVVDFDLTSRPPPLITEQTTVTLEELIRRRIKDKAWDDVVKKEKPVDDSLSFRKQEILDHSKSKLSLAQVYEAEYLKQKHGNGESDEKEPESHMQIRDAMKKLFAKLDAMSNCHFTPKAPQADVKIISNTPAITMEEVAPVATSNAALLAPEEVKPKKHGDLISKEERSATDKKRERRKKKKLQKLKGHVEKVTDNRNTKKGVEASDKSLKTSKAFFQQLNDDATSLIKNKNNKRNVKNKGQ